MQLLKEQRHEMKTEMKKKLTEHVAITSEQATLLLKKFDADTA